MNNTPLTLKGMKNNPLTLKDLRDLSNRGVTSIDLNEDAYNAICSEMCQLAEIFPMKMNDRMEFYASDGIFSVIKDMSWLNQNKR